MKNNRLTLSTLLVFLTSFMYCQIIIVPEDFQTIQQAINASVNGDTVVVNQGTYNEHINFAGKNIVVGSQFLLTGDTAFIMQTIIDGGESGSVVKFNNGESSAAKICGFTIRNGYAQSGAGIYILSASPTISYNLITSNSGDWYCEGNGIYLKNSSSLIQNNLIHNNSWAYTGAGLCLVSCSGVVISHNKITDNHTFSGYGVDAGAGAFVQNCTDILFENNLFSGNNVDFGDGDMISTYSSTAIIRNCTFYNSSSSGISLDIHGNVLIENSIIWSLETFYGTEIYGDSLTTVQYSNIKGGFDGISNLQVDPLFYDFDNFGLSQQSPCINNGNPDLPADPDGTVADMGWKYFDLSGMGTITGKINLGEGLGGLSNISIHANGQISYPLHDSAYAMHLLPGNYNIAAMLGLHQEQVIENVAVILNETTGGIDFNLPNTYANMAIHIRQDGTGDFTEIQPGIDVALPGDTVLAFPGIYNEELKIIGKPIILGSLFLTTNDTSYIQNTILQGDAFRPLKIEYIPDTALTVTGFTIQNGLATNGGGLYVRNSSPRINNCVIKNNVATNDGGGMYNLNSAPVINNCMFYQNNATGGGGISNNNSNAIILNCKISNNTANYGGGIEHVSPYGIIKNCLIENNTASSGTGGGIEIRYSGQAIIINNKIVNNNAHYGAGMYIQASNPILINNILYENYAVHSGGGLRIRFSSPLMVNNTIAGNTADSYGGGICFYDFSNAYITNNILWGNVTPEEDQIAIASANADPNFYFCDIEGGTESFYFLGNPGSYSGQCIGIMNGEPEFISPDDFQLQIQSPCINAGTPMYESGIDPPYIKEENGKYILYTGGNDTLHLPAKDIAGNPRITGGRIDMGAYEFTDSVQALNKRPPHLGSKVKAVPNPMQESTSIEFTLLAAGHCRVEIYKLDGQLLTTLLDAQTQPGNFRLRWHGTDQNGTKLPPGYYIISVILNNKTLDTVKVGKV